VLNFFTTGVRVAPPMDEPPEPGTTPRMPSRDVFALSYYKSTPVSLIPNHWLLLSFASQLLTLAQTCRKRDARRRTHTLILLLLLVPRRVRLTSHRYIAVVLLPVLQLLLVLRLLPVLLLRRSDAHLLSAGEIWGSPRRRRRNRCRALGV